jgi:hypothetical protein
LAFETPEEQAGKNIVHVDERESAKKSHYGGSCKEIVAVLLFVVEKQARILLSDLNFSSLITCPFSGRKND